VHFGAPASSRPFRRPPAGNPSRAPATAAVLADQTTLNVTLVPLSVSGDAPPASDLKYRKIYLTIE